MEILKHIIAFIAGFGMAFTGWSYYTAIVDWNNQNVKDLWNKILCFIPMGHMYDLAFMKFHEDDLSDLINGEK